MTGFFSDMAERSASQGFSPGRLIKRIAVLAFAAVQAVLVARILLDLGVIPEGWSINAFFVSTSDALAAPVEGLGGMFGSFGGPAGDGFNPLMMGALIGWTMVEALVMRVVNKVASI
jgi:hypothetical protein